MVMKCFGEIPREKRLGMDMKESFYFFLDLGEYVIRGYLLYQMLSIVGRVQKNPAHVEKRKKYMLIAQYVLLQMAFSYISPLKKFIYGGNIYLQSSKQTMVVLIISFMVSALFGCCYGSHVKELALYLVCTYYAIGELVRFVLYVPGNFVFNNILCLIEKSLVEESVSSLEQGVRSMLILEVVWNVLFVTIYLLFLWYFCGKFRKCFQLDQEKISGREYLFLMSSSVIGFFFCLFLRSILFTYKEMEYTFLLDENPELRFLVPMIALLGICSILLSAFLWSRLKKEQEEKNALLLYEEKLSEMEEHVQEMERLYEGMRGMKHDMKNYVADIESLIGRGEGLTKETGEALQNYLNGLCVSLEELDMKYKTGNPVTDTVINRYLRKAEKMGVKVSCDFLYPANLEISGFDLSILLNNGLENAIEALEKCGEEELFLEITSYVKGNVFFLEIRNTFFGTLPYDEEKHTFQTTKEEKNVHGYGLKNMKKSVEKYYGNIEFEINDNTFSLIAMLLGKAF